MTDRHDGFHLSFLLREASRFTLIELYDMKDFVSRCERGERLNVGGYTYLPMDL